MLAQDAPIKGGELVISGLVGGGTTCRIGHRTFVLACTMHQKLEEEHTMQ